MHILNLSVSLPDATHPDMQVRVSGDELACKVVITVPTALAQPPLPAATVVPPRGALAPLPAAANDAPANDADAYVLGGYAGI